MDLDPEVEPDFLRDARDPWPWPLFPSMTGLLGPSRWRYILIDPPYSPLDAGKYPPGAKKYPTPFQLLSRAVEVLDIGGKVGIIHYQWAPLVPGLSRELAVIAVGTGRNQRARFFTVFERIEGGIFEAEKMQTDGETNQKKRKKEEETEDPRQKTFSSLFGSTQENSKKQEKGQ